MSSRFDVYQAVTDTIVSQLERGVRPWSKPYTSPPNTMPLRHNNQPYRGCNVFLLWVTASARGYTSPYWMTYNQAFANRAQVRKGEKGTTVVYYSFTAVPGDEDEEKRIPFMRAYTVFNADQIDGLSDTYHPKPPPPAPRHEQSPAAEAFFAATGSRVRTGSFVGVPCYYPSIDCIDMPATSLFKSMSDYYATLAHEHVHWTGAKQRLDRDLRNRFGSEAYGMEELTAEMGAAFVCAHLGITNAEREDHACYIQAWLNIIRKDKRAIFTVASKAQQACDYLRSFSESVGDESVVQEGEP